MTEQQLQSKKIKELKSQGYYVIKLISTNKNGIPDLIAIPRDCGVLFVEIKAVRGVLSPLQRYRIGELANHGLKTEICRAEKS